MKPWFLVILFPAVSISAYFILNPGHRAEAPRVHSAISPDHPFFHPKAAEIAFGADGLDSAKKAFADGRVDDTVAILGHIYAQSGSVQERVAAMGMAGQALMQKGDPDSRRFAEELFTEVVRQYQGKAKLDSAEYNLGLIAIQDSDGPRALYHLTTVLRDYPDSDLAPNAASVAQHVASLIAGQNESPKGRLVAYLNPLLPENPTALIGILTSMVTTLIWFAHDWQNHYKKLVIQKDPVLWVVVILVGGLAVLNYAYEDKAHAKSMLDVGKVLPAVIGR